MRFCRTRGAPDDAIKISEDLSLKVLGRDALTLVSSCALSQSMATLVSTLILLRHGQSTWNGANARFTGWSDVPLTVKGRVEAVGAGQLLRSRGFRAARVDVAFTSELQRAHETCELLLASMAGHEQDTWSTERIRRDWRLNERHYGAVQGLYKSDPKLAAKYGADTIRHWRRSMDGKPPPMNPSHMEWQPPPAPACESLLDCQQRALACLKERIAPALFDEADPVQGGWVPRSDDRTVVVVAHSNTIRSLMAYFDEVPDEDVPNLHVPNSVPILYRFERSTQKLISTRLQGAAGGSHARWLFSPENHVAIREAIQPGGMLTRAVLDSWDRNMDGVLTLEEIEGGINAMLDPNVERPPNCAVVAVAKKVVRELRMTGGPSATMTIEELEKRFGSNVGDIYNAVQKQNERDILPASKLLIDPSEEPSDFYEPQI